MYYTHLVIAWLQLLLSSALLSVLGSKLQQRYSGAPPLHWTAVFVVVVAVVGAYSLFGVAAAAGAGIPFELLARKLGYEMESLFIGIAAYYYPLWLAARMSLGVFSEMFTNAFLGSSLITPAPSSYGKARALANQGAILGAVREYRKYFEEAPRIPAPLFGAAQLLTEHQDYREAGAMYREIMQRFETNTQIWAEASLQFAEMYEQRLHDPKLAAELLRPILRRARNRKQRELAMLRLMRMSTAP